MQQAIRGGQWSYCAQASCNSFGGDGIAWAIIKPHIQITKIQIHKFKLKVTKIQ